MAENHFATKLAAIFYADVAGYSRLTGQDEEGTHRVLSAYLDLMSTEIERRGGRVVHYAGDAVLAEFTSVVDALSCAVEVQRALEVRNAHHGDDDKVQFRIGINLGEVIVDRGDLYGNGVNIAARLESLADSGGICISQAVRDAAGTKLPLRYDDMGHQSVKNIAEPVRAYRVRVPAQAVMPKASYKTSDQPSAPLAQHRPLWGMIAIFVIVLISSATGWFVYQRLSPPGQPLPEQPSIAVLPFVNVSNDAEQEYFSDGITNDVITDLSKFSSLVVIASTSVFAYKGKPAQVQDISRALGVRYVLQGSVQKASETFRVNVQLIDTTTSRHLWAERYHRDLQDLFSVQDEIVRTIVTTLAVKLTRLEKGRALAKPTDNLEAHDYVLRGREYLAQTTRSTNIKARQMFEQAIELDPRYASAYVGLGWTHTKAVSHGWTEFPVEALEHAHDLAQQALSIEESASAYRLLGYVYLPRRQYDLANDALTRAMALNPNDWDSQAMLGSVLLFAGQPNTAIELFQTALQFNPYMDVDRIFDLGMAYYLEKRYLDAIKALEQSVERYPNHVFLHAALAAAYAQVGRDDDAQRAAATVRRLYPFFEVAAFGTRFQDPQHIAKLAEGLRKAGLE